MSLTDLIRWHKAEAALYDREGYFAEQTFHEQAVEILTALSYESKVSA